MAKGIAAIILAAGKGKRMQSDIPKVLHPVCGRPMLLYIFDLLRQLRIAEAVTVVGYKAEAVKKVLPAGAKAARQKRPLGTADAVRAGLGRLSRRANTVLALYGDAPLLKAQTLKLLLQQHARNNAAATILTAQADEPKGYGRILRDKYAAICGIVEDADADSFEKEIKEVNTGIICFQRDKLASSLKAIRRNRRKKEFYLTDIIALFYKRGWLVEGVKLSDIKEAMGINSRVDLAQADALMRRRLNEEWMGKGVTIVDPASTFISFGASIGRESIIYPFTVVAPGVKIGRRCLIGPFVHLREGTRIEDNCLLGNFVEVVRSALGRDTWAKHFCYLGDSRVGKRVNIGAGTVTANFDHSRKNTTVIKDNAFIGSDTVLVAPVKIGRGAKTGAGAVVAKRTHVPDGSVVVGVPARLLKK
jgi:bifunctional UDP-N-acetylglucosamine pyrophosphorylase/glucosamine-1-phosphate N-acetyltransferase